MEYLIIVIITVIVSTITTLITVKIAGAKNVKNKFEINIDKSQGTIYYEELPNGKKRTICGFCWEKSQLKTPVLNDKSSTANGYCYICKVYCKLKSSDETE